MQWSDPDMNYEKMLDKIQEWVSGGIRTQHILKKYIKIDLGYTRKKIDLGKK